MCLIVFAYNYHPDYKLIFAANRDEFYNRPALPAHFWQDKPILAGKDLKAGGTWCGITRTGKIAAITNYRDLRSVKKNAASRGGIVTDYLAGLSSHEIFCYELKNSAQKYNGYSLIFGDKSGLYFSSNYSAEIIKIENGIHGLSNHLLNTPWFNVRRGKRLLKDAIGKNENLIDNLFLLLSDKSLSPDDELPDTGLPAKTEKNISSIFVETEGYGTRASTVILIDKNEKALFIEKSRTDNNNWVTNTFEFKFE